MSQNQILQHCNHISRVKEWGFDDTHNFRASLWDCINCGSESSTPFLDEYSLPIDHSNCDYDPCFGCKAKGLQLNTGDAGRPIADKKWQGRLKKYRDARAQGIQPASTNEYVVEASIKASEILNKPYNAETMVRADKVTKEVASVMKEIGD